MMDSLAAVLLAGDTDDHARVRVAVVSSTSPLEVTLAGQSGIPAARLASYTATLSDRVALLQSNTDLVILDKIISGG